MGCTRISPATARRCALNAQLLDGRTKLARGKEGVAQAVEKLGYVQIDTISVVERAHHHTLWTRCSDSEKAMLDEAGLRVLGARRVIPAHIRLPLLLTEEARFPMEPVGAAGSGEARNAYDPSPRTHPA